MKKIMIQFAGLLILIISAGMFYHKLDFRNGRNYNVCKSLKGDVLVYIIFIDTKTTSPWTDFDIKTTMDSVNIAIRWLEEQAMKNNINLKINTDYYIGQNLLTIIKDLPEGTVRKSLTTPNLATGIENINKWADFIAKKAGATFEIVEKEGIPEVKNPKNKERFIAYLRNQHKIESVALLFLVNNYYRDDISIAVNTMSSNDIEFSIVSYKYPSGIAHNILHLFGAADLHQTPFRKNDKNINFALQEFPDEIMQNPYAKNLPSLKIENFTKYLIGWTDTIDNKYEPLFIEKGIKLH